MWTLEHSLQFFGLATSMRMTPILSSSASSALRPMLPGQAHGGNTTFPSSKCQSQFLSPLARRPEVSLGEAGGLQALHPHQLPLLLIMLARGYSHLARYHISPFPALRPVLEPQGTNKRNTSPAPSSFR